MLTSNPKLRLAYFKLKSCVAAIWSIMQIHIRKAFESWFELVLALKKLLKSIFYKNDKNILENESDTKKLPGLSHWFCVKSTGGIPCYFLCQVDFQVHMYVCSYKKWTLIAPNRGIVSPHTVNLFYKKYSYEIDNLTVF